MERKISNCKCQELKSDVESATKEALKNATFLLKQTQLWKAFIVFYLSLDLVSEWELVWWGDKNDEESTQTGATILEPFIWIENE